ncbi:hypothetical protein LUZ60_016847 [Juncus effusus]|nr:hypothetical protein LUZ60_016847 [Juncus effusus]
MSLAMVPTHVLPSGRHASPLNPKSSHRTTGTSTKIQIANLDKLLQKSAPKQPNQNLTLRNKSSQEKHDKTPHLLNALNLPSFFPFVRKPAASDEMSPRSLTHLQKLLSDSPKLSPKNTIASRWRQYHGENDWHGLLDPLNENLRRELIRYGDFIQMAYHAFHSLPSCGTAKQKDRHLLLPDRSYKHTKNLYATSSLSFPEWARRPGTPAWLTQRTSCVGYVAVCDSEKEISRMGRRDIVIVLRGTTTCLEWAENLRTSLTPLNEETQLQEGEEDQQEEAEAEEESVPKVARGFLSLYRSSTEHTQSLSESIKEEIQRLLNLYKGEELSITIVGHSLGAALALLAADDVSTCSSDVPPIAVVSFGGPKVGDKTFKQKLAKNKGVKVLRIVNEGDFITRVPGVIAIGGVRDGYEHVGVELRVDSRVSPYLRSDAGPACSHDLEAYLHLIDGFKGTGEPFRSNANRSIVKLLKHQRTSVKEVYLNRAKMLGVDPSGSVLSRAESFGCA